MPASLSVLQSGVPPLHEVRKRKEKMTPINLKAKRIHRGGSWSSGARCCRAGGRDDRAPGSRYDRAPGYRRGNLGFRLSTRYVRGRKK